MDRNPGNITATILVGQKIFVPASFDPKYPVDTRVLIVLNVVTKSTIRRNPWEERRDLDK